MGDSILASTGYPKSATDPFAAQAHERSKYSAEFHLTEKNQARGTGNRFYLCPALGKVLESAPLERVNFIRDEMANMVWGVESIVPSRRD